MRVDNSYRLCIRANGNSIMGLNLMKKSIENIDKEKLKVVEEAAKIFEETLQIKLTKDEMYYIVSMI